MTAKTTKAKLKPVGQGGEVETTVPTDKPKRKYTLKNGRPPKKLDRDKVKQLMASGLSESDIAKHQGVAPSSIHKYIHTLSDTEIQDFKAKRADVLALSQLKAIAVKNRVLNHVIDMPEETFKATSDQAKIGYGNLANVSAGTDYDKERIERGESTQNISILVGSILDLKRAREAQDINDD
jgi:predicted transcriptional regulator